MSASTPASTACRAEGGWLPGRFWLWSLAVHGLVLVIWALLPERQVSQRAVLQPTVSKRGSELHELIEQFRLVQEARLRERVALLGKATDRMRLHLLNRQETWRGFAHAQQLAVHERISWAFDEVEAASARLDALLAQLLANQTWLTETTLNDIGIQQANASNGLDDAITALPLLPAGAVRQHLGERLAQAQEQQIAVNAVIQKMLDGERSLAWQGAEEERQGVEASQMREELARLHRAADDAEGEAKSQAMRTLEQADARFQVQLQRRQVLRNQLEQLFAQRAQLGATTRQSSAAIAAISRACARDFARAFDRQALIASIEEAQPDALRPPRHLLTLPDDQPPSVTPALLAASDTVDLVAVADRCIVQAATDYRNIRAMELARLRDLPFVSALEQIRPVEPPPKMLDVQLLRQEIRTPALVAPHKRAMEQAQMAVEERLHLIEALLMEIERSQQDGARPGLEALLLHGESEPKAPADTGGGDAAYGHEERSAQIMQTMIKGALANEQERWRDVSNLAQQRIIGDALSRPAPSEQGARPEGDLVPETPGLLGRSLRIDGQPTAWLFVDTWYTIGPFPNEGRRHLNTRFPPESVIDLDAVYEGKDDRLLHWRFVQAGSNRVVPADAEEYGIWYAYTEIYSDLDRDLWIAVGSDDKANLWINDQPVWISSDRLKGWNIAEGFRKVHFRAGRNRVLCRVENGWLNVAFSLCIHAVAEQP